MSDYKELIERLRNAGGGDLGIKMCHEAADAIEQLVNDRNASVDALKALVENIDAEPVRHGHWILEREPNGKPYCFHCSVCDYDFHHIGIKSATDYCPNCGAKMGEMIDG